MPRPAPPAAARPKPPQQPKFWLSATSKPDIQANKANSSFIIASGKQTALSPYFSQFVVNADQWDGYNAERKR